ncbi:MAG: type II toxin-antitoxin system VapC family toxin [Azospirillaceae bacterium]|nr:type II toxin-antitoxin system VapC family toxin [Azospirillaceae bacterium]
MKIIVDTNVLLRAFLGDDAKQAAVAKRTLEQASLIAIPVPAFCEFVWVLRRQYKVPGADIAAAIEALLVIETVQTDLPAVEAGLAVLKAGGDFADGAIAAQGGPLGGALFATFDQTARLLWQRQGGQVAMLE